MNYELAKQLKDAGFPQEGKLLMCQHGATIKDQTEDDVMVAFPTLSELIEACGEELLSLHHFIYSQEELDLLIKIHGEEGWLWEARGYAFHKHGTTPIEAVAKLYIALKENRLPSAHK